jgi:hypothetical protein
MVFKRIKAATFPGDDTVPLFVRVEPHLSSGNVELLAKKEHGAAAARWISEALKQIALRAPATSFAVIFQNPGKPRTQLEISSNRFHPVSHISSSLSRQEWQRSS